MLTKSIGLRNPGFLILSLQAEGGVGWGLPHRANKIYRKVFILSELAQTA